MIDIVCDKDCWSAGFVCQSFSWVSSHTLALSFCLTGVFVPQMRAIVNIFLANFSMSTQTSRESSSLPWSYLDLIQYKNAVVYDNFHERKPHTPV